MTDAAPDIRTPVKRPCGLRAVAPGHHFIAKVFGGRASFLNYAYATSLIVVPISTIMAVAFIIPVLGVLVMLAGGLYALYLLVLATQSAHAVSAGKATAIILTPVAVSLVLNCLLYAALFAFVLALLHGAHEGPARGRPPDTPPAQDPAPPRREIRSSSNTPVQVSWSLRRPARASGRM